MNTKILIVDDEESIRYTFQSFLAEEGHEVITAGTYDEAISRIKEEDPDLIFMDILLGGDSGIDLLRETREISPECPVIMTTGYPNVETASDAVRLGAFDYLFKPVDQEKLLHTARIALQYHAIYEENERYRSHLETLFNSVNDAIMTIDKDLIVTAVNDAAVESCGITKELKGKCLKDFREQCICRYTPDCNCKCVEALLKTVTTKKEIEISRTECTFHSPLRHVVSIRTSPLIDKNGKFSGAVMVIRDETRINELERDLRERSKFHKIIGQNRDMQKIYSLIEDLADFKTNVLITGESGTGKELIAEAIHYSGIRSTKPLVKVNCSALSEDLLESELFGHVKGAFTGADRNKVGRFELADGGTIFLDEIGDISPRMQLRLLRAIQENEFERVGDSTTIKTDVRVIAATNQDLQKKVFEGKFREDLLFRLRVVEISIPPLRERKDDIPLLANHFIEKLNKKLNKQISAITEDVQRIFLNYSWPGNIRELEHALEHAFVVSKQNIITVDMLPKNLTEPTSNDAPSEDKEDKREKLSPGVILEALKKSGWNKAKAARSLNVNVRTIYRKIEKYDLEEAENR